MLLRCLISALCLCVLLTGCESTYYAAWEKLGVEKRDLLADRVEDAQEAQEEGKEQFVSALEQFQSVVAFDGGDLEDYYKELSAELEDSQDIATTIRQRIDDVENVADDLFAEWQEELEQYSSARLRQSSADTLRTTQTQYNKLIRAMRKAEDSMEPVLAVLNDNVLFLKHNLNARAIASLKGELATVDKNVDTLLANMQSAIDESNAFIASLNQ